MAKFSLDDDAADDDDADDVENERNDSGNDDDSIDRRRLRLRRPLSSSRPMTSKATTSMNVVKIETLDDYDVSQSFEAMDRHKLQVLAPVVAYQIILALGYLGHGNHHSDKGKFTYSRFQDEVMKRHHVVAGRKQQQRQQQQQQNIDSSIGREYEEEIVTLPMLLDIIKKNSDVLRRDRSENIEYTFDNGFDQDKKGYLTASDLQRIALEVDGEEGAMSDEEAEVMARLTTTTRTSMAKSHQTAGIADTGGGEGAARVSLTDVRRVFAPPSP